MQKFQIIQIGSIDPLGSLGIVRLRDILSIMRLLLSIFLATSSAHDDGHGTGPGGPGHGENSKEMIVCDENELFDDCPLCSDSMCDGTPQGGFLSFARYDSGAN